MILRNIIDLPEPYKFKLCFGLYLIDKVYYFNLLGLWIKLTAINYQGSESEPKCWAITYKENSLIINRGLKATVLFMPWDLVRVSEDVLTCEGTWVKKDPVKLPHFSKLLDVGVFSDDRLYHEAPYLSVGRNGEAQKTLAAFYVSRSFFKWRMFRYSEGSKGKTTHWINVTFKNPVGKGVGTYSGGVTSCKYEIRSGENPFQTLARMEKKRRL